jgi:multiple sugar transport system permease protein
MASKPFATLQSFLSPHIGNVNMSRFIKLIPYNAFVWGLLALYLMPVGFMAVTAMMPTEQLSARDAPLYPARIKKYIYEGEEYQIYQVPTDQGIDEKIVHLALINPGIKSSEFIDPQNPEAGLIHWEGSWRQLTGVYEFSPTWENFLILFQSLPFTDMVWNTLLITLIGEIGVVTSSILVAYGFARFRLPGGNLLFYVLIATILIPEKITFIPSYFFFINVLNWKDTLYPLLLPMFFGNAVYIFLLRQNFRSIPAELEEAAMLDGAGPIRRLFSIILPQSWPVITTITLLHFFYSWNETRLAALYLSTKSAWMPVSFGIQNYQSLIRIDNVIQAGTIVALIVPVFVLLQSQKFFMQGLVITGTER